MSRYVDHSDDDSPEMVLAHGRWERNARAVLRSKRGQAALRELREALMALPEHRLIEGALCTVGPVEERVPQFTDEEMAAREASHAEYRAANGMEPEDEAARAKFVAWYTQREREGRLEQREALARDIERQGCGVCVNGALLWHRLVKGGMSADEAFSALPTLMTDEDGVDYLDETARVTSNDAGIAYTLAWELAYRNDEIYRSCTPEQRWDKFIQFIDQQLAAVVAA